MSYTYVCKCGWRMMSALPLIKPTCPKCGKVYRRGLGDRLAAILEQIGGSWFKRTYKQVTGKDCGCGKRQVQLNRAEEKLREWISRKWRGR